MSQTTRRDVLASAPPAACFHGGASFEAIGTRFDDLSRRHGVISADVLDAWFDPAPAVLEALREPLPWLLRTSPPTHAEGLLEAVAAARGVDPGCLVPGAGSSDLIFRAFTRWLDARSRALILEPMYGEYAHVLGRVIGCRVDRLVLRGEEGFDVSADRLAEALRRGYDLVALVNPNNPTGRHVRRGLLESVLSGAPERTRVWVDEAYIEYVGAGESLERWAATTSNVVVCKSMSKVYALSGLRVGYLCGGPEAAAALRRITPPWPVSLPAQVAAVRALESPEYYAARYRQTHRLRERLRSLLTSAAGGRLETLAGRTNSVLAFLPPDGPTASDVVAACRRHGLFVRDAGASSPSLGSHAVRFAVKAPEQNAAMGRVLGLILGTSAEGSDAPRPEPDTSRRP